MRSRDQRGLRALPVVVPVEDLHLPQRPSHVPLARNERSHGVFQILLAVLAREHVHARDMPAHVEVRVGAHTHRVQAPPQPRRARLVHRVPLRHASPLPQQPVKRRLLVERVY